MSTGWIYARSVTITDPDLARHFFEIAALHSARPLAWTENEEVHQLIRGLWALSNADETDTRNSTEPASGSSQRLTARAAATQLRIGPAAVRKALRENRLDGELVDGRWTTTTEAINAYRRTRAS